VFGMQQLTGIQRNVLSLIESTIKAKGFAPSSKEIATALGISEARAGHIARIELPKKGYIAFESGKPRSLRVLKSASEEGGRF